MLDSLCCSYGHNIYQLFDEMSKDADLDVIVLIQDILIERLNRGERITDDEDLIIQTKFDLDTVSNIYLFFDLDKHATNSGMKKKDSVISKMDMILDTFSDSQTAGAIFISYPMVEAIRHWEIGQPKETFYPSHDEALIGYKKYLSTSEEINKRYFNWGEYDGIIWKELINEHLKRANLLVNNIESSTLNSPISQKDIYAMQLRMQNTEDKIAVISAFPLMLYDYYGANLLSFLNE